MRLLNILSVILLSMNLLEVCAQPKALYSDSLSWNFGRIYEENGPVVHRFRLRNCSPRPVVITDVTATCGCTKPRFSRQPVLPGEVSEIEVAYDPANRPGVFDRKVSVFTSAGGEPLRLQIVGEVIPRKRSIEELYPYDWGNGLRASTCFCDLGTVPHGAVRQSAVELVNASLRPMRLQPLCPVRSGWLHISMPSYLAPGERCAVNLRYEMPDSCRFYGSMVDEIAFAVNGSESAARLEVRGVAVDNPLTYGDNSRPCIQLNKNIVKFGPVKRASGPRTALFELRNIGEEPLTVRAVECSTFGCSLRPGTSVAPGGRIAVSVRLDPLSCEYGIAVERIRIVTDDPQHPLVSVRATAVIEE